MASLLRAKGWGAIWAMFGAESAKIPQNGRRERYAPANSRQSHFPMRGIVAKARHHGVAAIGPIGVSAAHFVASIALLRVLSGTEFGQFSFVIVVSALGLGLTNALLCAPLSSLANRPATGSPDELHTCFKSSLVLIAAISVITCAIMLASGVTAEAAGLFGIYGGAMALRLFARTWAYWSGSVRRVVLSDISYGVVLLAGLGVISFLPGAHIFLVSAAMAVASVLSLVAFGQPFGWLICNSLKKGSLRSYRRIWRDITRWSLAGVLTTEISTNAHAYLVTFICGSKAFALLAVGSLFMRPFSLIAAALPDQERPAMARSIAAGDVGRAFRIANGFLVAIAVVWCGTAALSASVLAWFPDFIIRKGYDRTSIIAVVVWWAMITAVRGIRARDAVLLQAARAYRPLADASTRSCLVALAAAFLLLMAFGPVASLAGILIGDIVMLLVIAVGVRNWKAQHPAMGAVQTA